jgi:hypothetical protein
MRPQANGCGPKGTFGKLIPDSLLGVSVHEACNLHDELYSQGGTSKERKEADKFFLDEMLKIVDKNSESHLLKVLRKSQAYLYFYAVRLFGRFFFGGEKT